jgi:tetratricopeptide (TPR) repeat protein
MATRPIPLAHNRRVSHNVPVVRPAGGWHYGGHVKRWTLALIVVVALVAAAATVAIRFGMRSAVSDRSLARGPVPPVTIDYPLDGSVFPPEFPPPEFLWRDSAGGVSDWTIEVSFADGSAALSFRSKGEPITLGEIDQRCVSSTNELPTLRPDLAAAHSWRPRAGDWDTIKKRSANRAATVTFSGRLGAGDGEVASQGRVTIRTAADPVGAPIFYRDVPLMPSETEKGVIKPLAAKAVPLIAWRLRNVAETTSRLLMDGIYSCANCHSFSRDGKTMGIDLDGPQNDKGLYAVVPVAQRMSIRPDNMIEWSTFRGKLGGRLRVGFMSQVSPDGSHVVTTISDPGRDQSAYERRRDPRDVVPNYYVQNFKDYRFLQVFFPTRGVLAWYSRSAARLQPLPGADDTRFVHANATWSPDGSYLVFARAQACDAYPPGAKPAGIANDPNETQIQYDLYRIPFNNGKGGPAEPVEGASRNGFSNNFAKISPDGRWIVFVRCRNGLLMRPDSELWIVPAAGGGARRMSCNTPLMNSWHSFSPNGRWLGFSSKSRSPYTQLYLTHLDESGNDTPAILVENTTAANRAVNIPEFVNIAPDGIVSLDAPVTEYYKVLDAALELSKNRQYLAALPEWQRAVSLGPEEPLAHNNLGVALAETGRFDEAVPHYRKAIELDPKYPEPHNNLGMALARQKRWQEAITAFTRALEMNPALTDARSNLGAALAQLGRLDEAIAHFRRAAAEDPGVPHVHKNLGMALASRSRMAEALAALQQAVKLSEGRDAETLDLLSRVLAASGRFTEAAQAARRALALAGQQGNAAFAAALKSRIASYESQGALRK